MKRLTCSQVVATVFTLVWAACPMAFAAERGKQEGKRVAREIVSRLVGVERVDSLVDQLRAMNVGTLRPSARFSNVSTLVRPEGTYVFDNLARDVNGNMSGHVAVYDGAEKIADYDISNIAVPDGNKISFSASVSTQDTTWTEDGVVTGVQGDPGMAVASISVDGADSQLSLVNFSGLNLPDSPVASASGPITVMSSPSSSEQSGVASSEVCLVIAACGTIVVVAVVVVIICYALSFFGVSCF
ncbi:MAG: hypothetical protein HY481_01010 [Candidatus Vogelbacteria bacterium]|nr:hypothetical protein [Candidatus Vogelbacteria bacterium]